MVMRYTITTFAVLFCISITALPSEPQFITEILAAHNIIRRQYGCIADQEKIYTAQQIYPISIKW